MILRSLVVSLSLLASLALAQSVEVRDAWVRSAVPGQSGTGAFMKITAKDKLRLLSASTPVAGVTEIHEMKMLGNVMQMRAVPALDLPAGKTIELMPGGVHLMLMDLKGPLSKDAVVPLSLLFVNAQGRQSGLELKLKVSSQAPASDAGSAHKH